VAVLLVGMAILGVTVAEQEPQLCYPELANWLHLAAIATDGAHLQDDRDLFHRIVLDILMDNTEALKRNVLAWWWPLCS
jgi:hypothetical protein